MVDFKAISELNRAANAAWLAYAELRGYDPNNGELRSVFIDAYKVGFRANKKVQK